jgi:Na+/melibiose symporter-like transporter
LVLSGIGLMTACAMLTGLDAMTPFTWLFAAYIVFGLGFGLVNAPITNAAVSGMPRDQAGVASAVASTSRQVGQTLGVAVVGALVASQAKGAAATATFATASHAAWWTLSACGAVVLVLGLVATSRRAAESARRTAAELNPEMLAHAEAGVR